MRLIDADKLKERIGNTVLGDFWFQSIVDQQETVDAEPVRHGEWIYKEYNLTTSESIGYFVCSECDCVTANVIGSYYCPHCGAKMNEVNDGNDKTETK